MKKDHYAVLEVSPKSSTDIIHAAWKVLAVRYKNDDRRLREINNAKEILMDDIKRERYDDERTTQPTGKIIGNYKIIKEIAEGGAMVDAAREALISKKPTCALVSGFHHAGYRQWKALGYFCTFNGLLVAAFKILNENHGVNNVAIIDCDQHWGNGTDDILSELYLTKSSTITHITFGERFSRPHHANQYLTWLQKDNHVENTLKANNCDLIIYQAGADVHVNDPYGGVLTTEQIAERDNLMFSIAKRLNIPIAWDLAGGYQIDKDGKIDEVIKIHLNTFQECQKVFGV